MKKTIFFAMMAVFVSTASATMTGTGKIGTVTVYQGCAESAGKQVLLVSLVASVGSPVTITAAVATSGDNYAFESLRTLALQAQAGKYLNVTFDETIGKQNPSVITAPSTGGVSCAPLLSGGAYYANLNAIAIAP